MPDLTNFLTAEKLFSILRVLIYLGAGLPGIWLSSRIISKLCQNKLSAQTEMIIKKVFTYICYVILLILILSELGFDLTTLLGAAGVLGIAIGFASQTSVSNLISGLFLISEKHFEVGDLIEVGGNRGVVVSIDLLSVKIRAFDNRFIRLPNETLIKENVINVTRFKIRRCDVFVGVSYKEDIKKVKKMLKKISLSNPLSLEEPAPLILLNNFGNFSLDFQVGVWCAKEDFVKMKQSLMIAIKEKFDKEGIEIPFPYQNIILKEESVKRNSNSRNFLHAKQINYKRTTNIS